MQIIDVLRNEKPVFILDDIEDKKTKTLITQINSQMSNILDKLDEFNKFAESQLNGEYNKKIVMAKSLQRFYSNWASVNTACANIAKEESDAMNAFNSAKNQLIDNLKTLLKDSQKMPVVCVYDVFGTDFVFAKKGHNVIVLGNNNTAIIETIISEIENKFVVEGNFSDVEPFELTANYSNVDKNVNECKRGVDEYFSNKPAKETKVLALVESMEKAARELVFFATYKNDIKNIGCSLKDVDLYEKELFKKYVPLKKQLSKLLKVEFVDVCDLTTDETEFPTQEFKAVDTDFFDE